MDPNVEHASRELCRTLFNFLLPLQTTKEINEDLFEKVDVAARNFAKILKEKDFIPKIPFKELYSAVRVLEAESGYSRNPVLLKSMASKLQDTAELIVWSECHEDHQLGVPRVK